MNSVLMIGLLLSILCLHLGLRTNIPISILSKRLAAFLVAFAALLLDTPGMILVYLMMVLFEQALEDNCLHELLGLAIAAYKQETWQDVPNQTDKEK